MTTDAFGPAGFVIDQDTGEVVASIEQRDAMAAELVALDAALADAQAEIKRLNGRREQLDLDLRALLATGERADGGSAWAVRVPAPRPSQRVSRSGCEPYVEQLLSLGLGSMTYQPPGIAELRRRAAEIVAAGIPFEQIAPEPLSGPDRIEVVAKTAGPAK